MKEEQKEHQRMIEEQKKRSRMKEEQKVHQRMIEERKKRSRTKKRMKEMIKDERGTKEMIKE
jgi:hypothetical protein